MNIAVNSRLLVDDIHGGIEWFTYETLSRITSSHPEHRFFFIFDRPFRSEYVFSGNIEPLVLPPRTRHPVLWYWWLEKAMPPLLRKISADLFVSPDGLMPLKTNIPCLPVIHDINFWHRKKDLRPLVSGFYRYYYPRYARRAARIATVSEYSKSDMVNSWGIDPGKIDIVSNGASDHFFPEDEIDRSITRREVTGGEMFFLFVGNLSPRKNVPNLIRAYNLFRANGSYSHKLVVAGDRFFLNGELDREYRSSMWKEDILFTGMLDRDRLRSIYSAAEALVFVPWFEGFGIPVVEAMKCGTPVIASNTTSLPEVGGDAALYVDPASPGEICSAMMNVAGNRELRKELMAKGVERSSLFSWDRSADLLWESIESSLNQT